MGEEKYEVTTESDDDLSTNGIKEKKFHSFRNFPFSVLFIVTNEFCERFSYYGMRAVLVLFLLNQLKFDEDSSTAIYHAFIVLCYVLPLFGAVVSDSCLGKYGTILILSFVYAVGNIIVSVSAIPIIRGVNIALLGIGLVIIAFGTGGIKPCVAAFGGDQFKESQTSMLSKYFALFYFSINAGSVISTLLTPVLRSYVQCFGTCECFTLAFGIPALLMICSIFIFILGTRYYIIKKPKKEEAQLYLDVPVSIGVALYRRITFGSVPGKKILHYACPKYSEVFMNDVGKFLRVLLMFLPLPIFWTLFDQQGSRWTLQANRMNGRLGKFTIQPDQMQALNPVLILVFIPIFETLIYPVLDKCHLLRRPLQRMVVGMLLAGLAFAVAGIIQLRLQSVQSTLKIGESKLIIYNSAEFPIDYNIEGHYSNKTLNSGGYDVYSSIESGSYDLIVSSPYSVSNLNYSISLADQNISQLYIKFDDNIGFDIFENEFAEYPPNGGESNMQIVNLVKNDTLSDYLITIESEGGSSSTSECNTGLIQNEFLNYGDVSEITNVSIGRYQYSIKTFMQNTSLHSASESASGVPWSRLFTYETSKIKKEFEGGAIYTIIVDEMVYNASDPKQQRYNLTQIEVDPPNSVSIFLQIPMYVLITAGEVMFSVTGLNFAYSQAPTSMKAMCQAAWLLTVAGGNFIVIIIAESSAFENRAIEFFFFAILIGVITVLFATMSYFYKYVDQIGPEEETLINDKDNESSSLIPDTNDNSMPGRGDSEIHQNLKSNDPESEF